ncbi:polyprotein of EF-Ts, chloroplastic [Magnolia sinica]|uniref:polyprotein of EF-Ts, chloroplastic n=1 Tax=Magnolia sinica TaxID=86752 RepID=UPI00265A721B|nr:polyprotein of EF-Ts, chloroplastic [Magnolia sinica]
MTPVIPCSVGNISLFPTSTFTSRKDNRLTKCKLFGKYTKPALPPQRLLLLQPISVSLFQKYSTSDVHNKSRIQILAATGTDVAIEEPNSVVEGEDADKISEVSPDAVETSEASSTENAGPTPTAQSKRPRTVRKSEMPPVKNEELIPGATFTGKVRSVQPFGAFVDFGAFTDGLVHVSQLSDSFVKDVGSIVSVGQEVKVRVVEANMETGRISLTMRESDDISKLQQRKDALAGGSSDKPRPARRSSARSNQKRDEAPRSTKFIKDQVLDGTVKNMTRAGAFISLPEGEEGFLPTSEESEGFGNIMGGSTLQVGQEVNVRVLRITRGQVTLTMKKEEDMEELNMKLNQGVVHVATNPFELAFRKNEAIATFLEEREKVQQSTKTLSSKKPEQIEGKVDQIETKSDALINDEVETEVEQPVKAEIPSAATNVVIEEAFVDGVTEGSKETDSPNEMGDQIVSSESGVGEEVMVSQNETEVTTLADDKTPSVAANTVIDEAPITDVVKEDSTETELPGETGDLISSSDGVEEDSKETFMPDEIPSAAANTVIDEAPVTDLVKEDKSEGGVLISSSESEVTEDVLVSQADDTKVESKVTPVVENKIFSAAATSVVDAAPVTDGVEEDIKETETPDETEAPPLVENEIASAASEEDVKAAPSIPEPNGSATSNEQADVPSVQESTPKATISPSLVKQLREETGAGMMDCKKALAETGGDIVKAQEFLRKKGLASAEKKASRATAEGRIGSYIHDSRIGVLIEVNCETDFVSRGDIFKELVDDLAMQVAACPQVQHLVTEDVPEEMVSKEREIEMQKEDLLKKPEQIREKIVEGRIRKRLEELALLEQPYIKNDKVVVKDWVKQTIATIGENIKVRRFVRFNLGEGLEKKSQDFAAEVAAQTAVKTPTAAPKDQPAGEAKETIEKSPPKVAVSAALVKQLREETGAGMMDCKKALSETGGDLEKAQEYLRKKGLSTADKKSSRLAAEGRIGSYIHDSRIGVLIEVNCETDFVGRSEKFKELVNDLAMQVVACPQVQFVSVEEIPESIVSKERELEMQREDLQSKPENIRAKIVDGRIAKRLGELALLEQPFIKDDGLLVKDLVKQTVAALGENIRVRRFVRFTLGEATSDAKPEAQE